jgi:hypothetical protein
MFSVEERTRIRDRVFALAKADDRVTGAALTGSGALNAEDRWSDIDTSFGIADGTEPLVVLDDWTAVLDREFNVVHHWDLRRNATIYRVYLLSGGLELDIAATPASHFGQRGPKFRLLFGEAPERPAAPPPTANDLIGWGWMAALDARMGIERGKLWSAEYWVGAVREQALALACLRYAEPPDYRRGTDRLPSAVTTPFEGTLVRSLEPAELRRALARATQLFIAEVEFHDSDLAERLREPLADLIDG